MARKKKQMDKLAWENSQALAAGMSYGKWKAMQDPVKIVKKDGVPDGWSVCEHCGKSFKPKTKRPQRFCDYNCQRQAYYQNHREMFDAKTREYRARKREEINHSALGGGANET